MAFDKIGAVYVWIAIIIVFSIWVPDTFPTLDTAKQILNSNAITGLAALAITIPLAARVFDLSFAYVMTLTGVAVAKFVIGGMPLGLAVLLGVAIGVAIGLINAFVVVVAKIDSFIGTLATGSLILALITMVTNDTPISDASLAGGFSDIGQTDISGITMPVFYCAIVAVAIWYLLEHTATGRRLYATGFNPDASRLAGVRVDRLRFLSLVTSGFLAGASGIVLASTLGSGSPTAGTPYLLPAFAAVFLGATQLKGGRFNAGGTIIAVLLLGTGTTGLALAAAPTVVAVDVRRRRPHRRPRRHRPAASRRRQPAAARACTGAASPAPSSRASAPSTSLTERGVMPDFVNQHHREDESDMSANQRVTSTLDRLRQLLLVGVAAMVLVVAGCGGDERQHERRRRRRGGGYELCRAARRRSSPSVRPRSRRASRSARRSRRGKKITFISCGVEACAVQGPILKEAASKLGWSVTEVGTDGSPEKVQGAFDAAIRDGADAVIINAADKDALAKQLADAKDAGVEFVTCCSLGKQGTDFLFNIATPEQNAPIGEMLAAKVVEDSGGKANSVYVNVSAFAILAAVGETFNKKYAELCPDCKTDTLDIPLTALGKDVPDRIVSYLRSHPDVNYIVLSESGSTSPGLTAALRAAGLERQGQDRRPGRQRGRLPGGQGRQHPRRRPDRPVLVRLRHGRRAGAQVRRRAGGGDTAGVLADDQGQRPGHDRRPGVPDRRGLPGPVEQALGEVSR